MICALLDLCLCREDDLEENPQVTVQTEHKIPGSPGRIYQSALPRKFSKLNKPETVPQTDTGDQVE